MVVVKWSTCLPSIPTIRVWISLKSNYNFSLKLLLKSTKNKQKEDRVWPFFKSQTLQSEIAWNGKSQLSWARNAVKLGRVCKRSTRANREKLFIWTERNKPIFKTCQNWPLFYFVVNGFIFNSCIGVIWTHIIGITCCRVTSRAIYEPLV